MTALVAAVGFLRAEERPLYLDSNQPVEKRVEDLLARLTLEEKISLVHADSKFTTAAIPRLGIPAAGFPTARTACARTSGRNLETRRPHG